MIAETKLFMLCAGFELSAFEESTFGFKEWQSEFSNGEPISGMFNEVGSFFSKTFGCLKSKWLIRAIFCSDSFGSCPDAMDGCGF